MHIFFFSGGESTGEPIIMADVVTKTISANGITNSGMVCATNGRNNYVFKNTEIEADPDLDLVESRLENRFDDVTYYTA